MLCFLARPNTGGARRAARAFGVRAGWGNQHSPCSATGPDPWAYLPAAAACTLCGNPAGLPGKLLSGAAASGMVLRLRNGPVPNMPVSDVPIPHLLIPNAPMLHVPLHLLSASMVSIAFISPATLCVLTPSPGSCLLLLCVCVLPWGLHDKCSEMCRCLP